MGAPEARTAGSRLAIVLTTVIVTTVVLAGGVALATVGINSVGSPQIKNNSVRSVDIKDNNVRTSDIQNGTVSSADIANGTVEGADIKDGTIASVDIGNGQVKTADIGTGQVQSSDIADGTVTSDDIADGAVRTQDINNGAVKPVDLAAKAKPAGVAFADGDQLIPLSAVQSVRNVVLDAPAPGHVIVTASGYTTLNSEVFDQIICSITDGAIALHSAHLIVADDDGVEASTQTIPLSGTRTFAVPAGPTTFHLVCGEFSGTVFFSDSQITALYVPQLYTP